MSERPQTHLMQQMEELGLATPESWELFHPRVRDRSDISAWRCESSGSIVLSSVAHMSSAHYENKPNFVFGKQESRREAVIYSQEDTERRFRALLPLILNKRWLDVGSGHGGILDLVKPYTQETVAIEPQKVARDALKDAGYEVSGNIQDLNGRCFDVITLYHVFEHISEPLKFLTDLRGLLAPGGRLIVEVPHAKDALLTLLDCPTFREFTLWSEHLILHTRVTLTRYLEVAGFQNIAVQGIQRYPLANHLYWLSKNKPGGHAQWNFLRSGELDGSYERLLAGLDATDTIYATAFRTV